MRKRFVLFSEEIGDFIIENHKGNTPIKMAALVKEKFDREYSRDQMRSFYRRNNLHSGIAPGSQNRIFSDEIEAFMFENQYGISRGILTDMVNEKFGTEYTYGQVRGWCKNRNLCNAVDTKFQPGHESPFKGKPRPYKVKPNLGQYKKGSLPHNTLPVGSIVKDTAGVWKQKVAEPNKWEYMHRKIWQEANGPIPKGSIIIFKDGNTDNYQLDNLMCITRRESQMLNRKHLRSSDAETTETAVLLAKLIIAKQDREKGDKK